MTDPRDLTLLDGGRSAFPAILSAIGEAKESLSINMFIWRDDRIGREMAEAVLAAADRGVKVEIVKDRYGAVLELAEECRRPLLHPRTTAVERLKAGALHALYAREAKRPEGGESLLYRRIAQHPNIRLSADRHRADHSKFYLIDGRVLFLGGVNIEDKENGHDLRGRVYGDYMVRLEGEAYVSAFLAARRGKTPPTELGLSFPMNCKETGLSEMEEHYLSLIASAERELLIVMAYLSPLPRFLSAIADAHRRGVRITVMIPEAANFQNDTNRRAVRRLMKRTGDGITVLFSKKMLHTKLMLTEKAISFGSCNITKKAFGQLDELNLCIENSDAPFPTALRESLARELAAATPVSTYRTVRYCPMIALAEGLLV